MKYTPKQALQDRPIVVPRPDGKSFALGAKVVRNAKPPVRPAVTIPEATQAQYKWAYENGYAYLIDAVEEKKVSSKDNDKGKEE